MTEESPRPRRPRGPVGWFQAAIQEALTLAFGIAAALVGGVLKALFGGLMGGEKKLSEPEPVALEEGAESTEEGQG